MRVLYMPNKKNITYKKKGGAIPINSQATVLQSTSYAPSLDNIAVKTGSILVGGKKKKTYKKRKSLKRSKKH